MPRSKVVGTIVSHIHDDESSTDYMITVDDSSRIDVEIRDWGSIPLYPGSWPLIREQIEKLMDTISTKTTDDD